jgi:hypothetical protein
MVKRAAGLLCLAVLFGCGPTPVPSSVTDTFQGTLASPSGYQSVFVGPGGAGQWSAEVTWKDAGGLVALEVFTADGTFVGRGDQPNRSVASKTFTWQGTAGATYRVDTYLQLMVTESYELRVTHPRP